MMNKILLTYHTLTTLIAEGRIDELRIVLDQREIDVNESDENNKTLLMFAAQSGHLNIVIELLLRGTIVDAEDEDNWTSLLYAAKEGHLEIINKLIENGAKIDHRDMGGWTALMWACYKGYPEIAKSLLHRGASANVYDKNHISCLTWASGRGHFEIVRELLSYGAKVNGGDKYGTTPLVWACRKGYLDIADELLRAGANVDTAGMYSWTPLIVATKGGFSDVVEILLEYKPNVNAVDMSGGTALTLACKEGYFGIATSLLSTGAYINLQDRNGDTNLIHATKAGHYSVIDALIKKYADVDIQGVDLKTALYWAVEKNFVDIVRLILNANPNTEIAAKGGDTPLMKATRSRNVDIVQMLIDKKAKVSSVDKKGDTALHIAMRAQSKQIVEIILRNPKNSQLLYRPNRAGETPYNIDNSQHRSILAQIFGARRLNTNEDNENLLGYDLYSSSLADILSEPTLSMPICVGLYAKWGSGKSFLLNKLEDEMHNFTFQRLEPTFEFSWLVCLLLFLASSTVGFIVAFATGMWIIGLSVGTGILFISSILLAVVSYGNKRHDWSWSFNGSVYLAEHLMSIKTLLQVIFCNPPASRRDAHLDPVRFLFTEQTKVSSSGEDVSVAQIITTLYSAIESEYGFFTTRFYRVFRPKAVSGSRWRYRRLCCIPNVVVAFAVLLCIYICCIILLISRIPQTSHYYSNSTLVEQPEYNHLMKPTLIALGCILGAVILTNIDTWYRMIIILIVSNQRRVKHVTSQSTSYLEKLKNEVELMTLLVQCMDGFVSQQTRLVVVVDGLDSCEQEKVLRVLDAVHLLFSDPNLPFVTILALDPHVIIKAIEANINRVFHNSSIRGHDYLRNIVHLPFYLQNSGLRKVQVAQKTAMQTTKHALWIDEKDERGLGSIQPNRRTSASSTSIPDVYRKSRKSLHKLKASDSIGSSICNIHHNVTGAQDLTKVLLTDDYFSDVNPRSMRRLLNIVYITGRLLKAFNIDFNWYHLAVWINTTERWPYHISWIIMYFELHENELEDSMSLKTIYEKIKMHIPTSKEEEPMLDLDHDERKFDVFLSIHSNTLHVTDLKIFLPFTINLDPYIRKSIHEDQHHLAALIKGNTGLATGVSGNTTAETMASATGYGVQGRWGRFSPTRPPSNQPWASPHSFIWRTEARQDSGQGTLSPGPTVWWDYPVDPTIYRTRSKQVVLPNEQKLSSLSVEGVINLLSSLENINKTRLADYKNVLAQNNINGQVLMSCDLTELKDVLKMSFGDWELFRVAVLSLRDQEYNILNIVEGDRSHILITKEKSRQANSEIHEKMKGGTSDTSDRTEGRTRRPNAALEKQVTLEENLIFGALETLSEEAQEDALEEKLERIDALADSFSPVLSVSEDHISDTDSHSTIGSIIVSPAEVDVLYIPRDSPSLRIRATSLPDSVPDIEKGSGEEHIYISSGEISTSHSLPGAGEFRQASCSLSTHSPTKYLIKTLSHEDDLKRAVLTASMERLAKRKIRFPSISSNGPPSPMSERSAKHKKMPRIATNYEKNAFDSDTSDSSSNNSQEKLLAIDKEESTKRHTEISPPNETTEVFILDDEHTPLVSPTHSSLGFQVQEYNDSQRIDSPCSPTTPTSNESRKMHRQFSIDMPAASTAPQEPNVTSVQVTIEQSASNTTAPLIYTQPVHSHNSLLSFFGKSSSTNFATVHQPIISSTESVCDILDETIL